MMVFQISKWNAVFLLFHLSLCLSTGLGDVCTGNRKLEPHDPSGWYNNRADPLLGSYESLLLRRLSVGYTDGAYAPAGPDRPNPLEISERVFKGESGKPSYQRKTALLAFLAQHVFNEIVDASQITCPLEWMNIDVPENLRDYYDGATQIPYRRTRYDFDTGHSSNRPREQMNAASPWLDGTAIYGPNRVWENQLRSFQGGRLKSQVIDDQEFPAFNYVGLPLTNPAPASEHKIYDAERLFLLGNPHSNENPALLSLGIIFFRWHNFWADRVAACSPNQSDQEIFSQAKKWVIATYQKIIFYDFLPAFLGLNKTDMNLLEYSGYKAYLNPGVSNEFESTAMRFIQTMIPPGMYIRSNVSDCKWHKTDSGYSGLRLCNTYWDGQTFVLKYGIDSLILGLASQVAEREDNIVVDDLRGYFYGPFFGFTRTDLVATTIQHGRDHGIADYYTARKALGLSEKNLTEIIAQCSGSSCPIPLDVLSNLTSLCGDAHDVDLFVGGILETSADGSPGELFHRLILDQFLRIRDGDRFWFENRENGLFTEEDVEFIRSVDLWDVVINTTSISEDFVQKDLFHFVPGDQCYGEAVAEHNNSDRTIRQENLALCVPLARYDYFTGSEVSFGVTFGLLLLFVIGCIVALYAIATVRTRRMEAIKRNNRRTVRKHHPEDVQSYVAVDWAGFDQPSKEIEVSLGPEYTIRVTSQRNTKLHRTLDLQHAQSITICLSHDGKQRYILLRVDKEYDLVLKFHDVDDRLEFVSDLGSFVNRQRLGLNIERREMREYDLLRTAVTKQQRQVILERFIRLAITYEGDNPEDLMASIEEMEDGKDIMECELSHYEFGELLALRPDSQFVQLMFELVDKDGSGSISFREFLDVTVIFAKGKPEDKIKLMFDMYDVDNSGALSRDEFKIMLRSMLETNSASLEQEKIDDAIASMFAAAGFEEKEELTLEDFNVLMGDNKDSFGKSSIKIDPGRVKRKENGSKKSKDSDRGSKKGRIRSSLSGYVRRTGRKTKKSDVKLETVEREYKQNKLARLYDVVTSYIENNKMEIFWFTLYFLVMCGVFVQRFIQYSTFSEHKGSRRITSWGLPISRGSAAALTFTYSTLLVTVSRNTITRLRETFLSHYIPFDAHLSFHKIVAYISLGWSVVHILGHASNFFHLSTQAAEDLNCIFPEIWYRSHITPKFHYWIGTTVTGVTAVLLVMVCALIFVFATQFSRRRVFRLFWLSHQLFVVYFMLMILHGSGSLIQPPSFHAYFIGPAVLFTLDKIVSIGRRTVEIPVRKADILPSDVTNLVFKRPDSFDYKSGQWVRIACTALGGNEYHPFTLTSAPHEEDLSLHIRAVGPWTTNLRQTYDSCVSLGEALPKIYLDGPYGEGHQDWYKFEVAVLIGAGIGVTPFASILKDIVYRSSTTGKFPCKKVYFVWVTRTQKHFEWLTDIIRDVEENDTKDMVCVHIFITQFFQEFDLRTTMLYICEQNFYKVSSRSLFTGLRSVTHFGRPEFVSMLDSIRQKHPDVKKYGIFSCGPAALNKTLGVAVAQIRKDNAGIVFELHNETF